MDVGGTPPWMGKVELCMDAYRDVGSRVMHDCMDAGGRATQEAKAEEQLPSNNRELRLEQAVEQLPSGLILLILIREIPDQCPIFL